MEDREKKRKKYVFIIHSVSLYLSDQSDADPSRKSHGSWSGSATTDDDDEDDAEVVGTTSGTAGPTIKNFYILYGIYIIKF